MGQHVFHIINGLPGWVNSAVLPLGASHLLANWYAHIEEMPKVMGKRVSMSQTQTNSLELNETPRGRVTLPITLLTSQPDSPIPPLLQPS